MNAENHKRIKFLLEVGDCNEVMTYTELCDLINDQEDNPDERISTFKHIVSHEGPLDTKHPRYKGAKWNVQVEWDSGEITDEPLTILAKDDPVTMARYAEEHGMLGTPGWKILKRTLTRQRIITRMFMQAKSKLKKGIMYKFSVRVPRNEKEAS